MVFWSTIVFALGLFACALLCLASYEIVHRFGLQGGKSKRHVMVEAGALVLDRIILNACMVVCLLLECATLVWDTVDSRHFPIIIRWPLVALAIAGIAYSGSRLFRLYLSIDRTATSENSPGKSSP